jgi:hypothetical protein
VKFNKVVVQRLATVADYIFSTSYKSFFVAAIFLAISGRPSYADGDAVSDGRLKSKESHTFEECIVSGGELGMQDEHETCTVSEGGAVFVKSKRVERSGCKESCGDGICQEIVCMALGCPCPETSKSCPKDCH